MPHLLFLAFWYPPSRASGVYRAIGITEAFAEAGWKTTVLTVDTDYLQDEVGSVDESLMDMIPQDVSIVRVPHASWTAPEHLRNVGWIAAHFPQLERKRREANLTPDRYQDWIGPAVSVGLTVAHEERVSHVLATGNPWSSFEAAQAIAREASVPYSLDFRDPWSFDVYTGHQDPKLTNLEEPIIESAQYCFHVNDSITQSYRTAYPAFEAKIVTVPNGFDASSVGVPKDYHEGEPATFGILGTATTRWPLRAILSGWEIALPHLPKGSRLLMGGHLGYFAGREHEIAAYFEQVESFEYLGPIPKSEVAAFYSMLDVTVLPAADGAMVTSGKVYELMAQGLPVVCVQNDDGGARTLLASRSNTIGVIPNAEQVAEALVESVSMRVAQTPQDIQEARSRAADLYDRRRTLNEMVQLLGATQ